jgi:hypothetical protein
MILVDTSVWISLINGRRVAKVSTDDLLRFVTCGPIVQEVLQGLRDGPLARVFRESFLAIHRLDDPLSSATFLQAAEIYQEGRKKGYTIRSSIDCLISAIAIENQVPVWHKDRDFRMIAKYTRLEALEWL